MKKLIIIFSLTFMILGVQAQHVTIVNETFSSTLSGWTITSSSSATWSKDTICIRVLLLLIKEVPSSSAAGDSIDRLVLYLTYHNILMFFCGLAIYVKYRKPMFVKFL